MSSFRNLCTALALLGGATVTFAQQDPQYTMYMWNMMAINPGYTGSADVLNITALARQQWTGLDGAPSTQSVALHSPLRNENIALGFSLVNDRIGPVHTTLFNGNFAYRIRTGENTRLSFGLQAGVNMLQAKLGELANVSANDPVFAQNVANELAPNFGFGVYYWGHKGFLGLSAPKLLENNYGTVVTATGDASTLTERRHYFLSGGYLFRLSDALHLRPMFMTKVVEGAPLSVDLNAMFILREKLWLGAAYRNQDSFAAIAAFQITDQLRAGYSYDMTTSNLRRYNNGSHELMLSYDLRSNKDRILTPRFF